MADTKRKRIILVKHRMGTQKTCIASLMETVLWNQSFKCSSQHGPNYLKVFLNLGLNLPVPLFFPLVILTCQMEILRINVLRLVKCQKVLLRCFCKGFFSSYLDLSRKDNLLNLLFLNILQQHIYRTYQCSLTRLHL